MIPFEIQNQMKEQLKQRPDIKKMRIARKCCLIVDGVMGGLFLLAYLIILLATSNGATVTEKTSAYAPLITAFGVLAIITWAASGIAVWVLNNLITKRINKALYEWVSNVDPQAVEAREATREVDAFFNASPQPTAQQPQPAAPQPMIRSRPYWNDASQTPDVTPAVLEQRQKLLSTVRGLRSMKLVNGILCLLIGALLLFLPLVSFWDIIELSFWDLLKEGVDAMRAENSAAAIKNTTLALLISWEGAQNILGSIGICMVGFVIFLFISMGVTYIFHFLVSILSMKAERKIESYRGGVVYYDDKDERYAAMVKNLDNDNQVAMAIIGCLLWSLISLAGPILYLRHMENNMFVIQSGWVFLCALLWLLQMVVMNVVGIFQLRRKEEMKILIPLLGKEIFRLR